MLKFVSSFLLFVSAPSTILLTFKLALPLTFSLSFMILEYLEKAPCTLVLLTFPDDGIFKAYPI